MITTSLSKRWAALCGVVLGAPLASAQLDVRIASHVPDLDPLVSVAGDFDGDGDVDVLARVAVQPFAPGDWRLLRNRGNGAFDAPFPNLVGAPFQAELVFDVDGDGDLDAIGMRRAFTGDRLVVALNDGTGTFRVLSETPLLGVTRMRAADLDGDGDVDVLVLHQIPRAQFVVLRNQAGTLVAEPPTSIEPLDLDDVHLADVDGDGDPDALAVLDGRELLVFANPGNGAFGVPLRSPLPPGARLLDVGDLDGDGAPDLVITTAGFDPGTSQSLRLFHEVRNDGRGGFPAARLLFFLPGGAALPDRARILDVDVDGDPDLVVQGLDGLRIARREALGLYQVEPIVPVSFALAEGELQVADFDGDGDPDWLGGERGSTSGVRTLANGTFALLAQYPFDEVRGRVVANAVASAPAFPGGLLSRADGRRDPGRPGFRGPDPGTGCIGHDAGVTVETGLRPDLSRGATFLWWQRERRPNPAPLVESLVFTLWNERQLGYACFVQGDRLVFQAGSLRVTSQTTIGSRPGAWVHVALSVEPARNTIRFWFDGRPEAPQSPGFLGPFLQAPLRIAPAGFRERSATEWLDLDDVRVHRGVLSAARIGEALRGEAASVSPQGDGCTGVTGPLAIEWLPNFGAGAVNEVRLHITRAAGGRPAVLLGLGLSHSTWAGIPLPLPISSFCDLAISPDVLLAPRRETLSANEWSGAFSLPLPADPNLGDVHVYAQGVAFLFVANELTTSETLDVHWTLR